MNDHPMQLDITGATLQQRLYAQSIELLRIACPPEGYYLATSFGKDSIVAQRLCDEAGVKYDAHTNVTGIDPPPLVQFGRKYYPEVERHYSGTSMWKLIIQKKLPPLRHMRYCCAVLKEDGGIGRTCVLGVRASESKRRAEQWAPFVPKLRGGYSKNRDDIGRLRLFDNDDIARQVQSCQIKGTLIVSPLYSWDDGDVWDFIHDRKMPYCELYDNGFERLGCIGCPMAKRMEREKEFAMWPKFRDAYVRAFQRLVEQGDTGKMTWKSGEEVMQWWLDDRTQEKPLDGQIEMNGL
jgi:phosphoadenosine phosphosulfate reductase